MIRTAYQPDKPSAWLANRVAINSTVIPHTVGTDDATRSLPQLFDVIVGRLLEYCGE